MRIDWAAQVLRDAKLSVVEEDGWAARGREFTRTPLAIILHHDASAAGQIPDHPSVIIHGRSGKKPLPGPLAQWYLNRNGVWHVVASGKANHAGSGYYNGLTSGNSNTLGIEAANNGVGEPWPEAQMQSYAKGVAAILKQLGAPSLNAIGHKEWAPSRKIDPSFDMNDFRAQVKKEMSEWLTPFPGVDQKQTLACRGTAPRWIRRQLMRLGFAVTVGDTFDESTVKAVRAFREKAKMKAGDVVDREMWSALALLFW